eukprot:Ihof_evm13s58 gene=Ihof_evmTU13s58
MIPCIMKRDAPNLGKLDPSNQSPHITEDTRFEIPFYMAHDFAKKGWADIELPRFYGPKYLGKLQAGAETVPLSEWCPHYYHLGLHLVRLYHTHIYVPCNFAPPPEVERRLKDLIPLLKQAFEDRLQTIVLTDHSLTEDMADIMRRLESVEKH